MSNPKSLAAKMRERLNKRAEKTLTQEVTRTEDLVQVVGWVDMPEYFHRATGAPGLPVGHITQVVGKSDTGKTTLVMMAMIEVQRRGGVVYLIDSEHKFSFERFRLMGGIPEDLVIIVVDSLEAAWDAFDTVNQDISDFRKTDPDTLVMLAWDSVAASVPDAILESEAGDKHVSVDAKINNTNVRKLRKRIRDNRIVALFINHTYWTMPKFGIAEEVVKGGSEMFFMSTLILKTKRRGWLKRTVAGIDEKYGVHTLLEVFKGHLGGSKAITPFYIVGQGILPNEETLKVYQEYISGVPGPEVNKYTFEQLQERYLAEPKKEKAPRKKGLKGAAKTDFKSEEDPSEEEREE